MPTQQRQLDTDSLHRKYLEERDKRLRADGESQFIEAKGEFADFAKNAIPDAPIVRDPISEELDVLVVGAGFGGMLTGAELRKAGVPSFRIVDFAGDFGGTWYWNRYPGVRCDIESYLYLPRLEEIGTIPSERYSTGAEIFEHAQRFGRHFKLYERALFQTKVEHIKWDDATERWRVTTDRGDEIRARFVTASQGPLAKVKLPDIQGLLKFKGKVFHSARWDYDYTGGNSKGGLTKLNNRRVAVIGTGATGIQILPKLAEHAERVYLFQRTPSAVLPRNNRPTDIDWFKKLPPGWQSARMDNFLATISFKVPEQDLVGDCWTDFFVQFGQRMREAKRADPAVDVHDVMQAVDYAKMEAVRAHVDNVITDPAIAEALKPWYNYLCKRPLYSDDYLEAFNKPNVTLVDTNGRGVDSVTEDGLVVNGTPYEVDAIVLATGYEVGAAPHKVGEYELRGRNGLTLDEKWADGVRTVHGTQMSGFPNLHIVGGTSQGTVAFNFTHVLEIQARHAVAQIAQCLASGTTTFEVTEEAERKWGELMHRNHVDMSHFNEECTPGFLNNEGMFRERPTFIGGAFGGGPLEYQRITEEWRQSGYIADTRRRARSDAAALLQT
jgi:cyclohexanone monooxygenase